MKIFTRRKKEKKAKAKVQSMLRWKIKKKERKTTTQRLRIKCVVEALHRKSQEDVALTVLIFLSRPLQNSTTANYQKQGE